MNLNIKLLKFGGDFGMHGLQRGMDGIMIFLIK